MLICLSQNWRRNKKALNRRTPHPVASIQFYLNVRSENSIVPENTAVISPRQSKKRGRWTSYAHGLLHAQPLTPIPSINLKPAENALSLFLSRTSQTRLLFDSFRRHVTSFRNEPRKARSYVKNRAHLKMHLRCFVTICASLISSPLGRKNLTSFRDEPWKTRSYQEDRAHPKCTYVLMCEGLLALFAYRSPLNSLLFLGNCLRLQAFDWALYLGAVGSRARLCRLLWCYCS